MNFERAITALNNSLKKETPETFNPSWIVKRVPSVYKYLRKNVRTETDDVDWDKITSSLDRRFQKRWVRYKYKKVKCYERQAEVDAVLSKIQDRLYLMISPADEKERRLQHRIIIALVRIGQKGNTCAQEEVIKWVTFIVDEWLDRYSQMRRWKGYESEIPGKIRDCIRLYRYTGSFLAYLFRTLEYSAFAKPPLCSLDDVMFGGTKKRHEYVVMDENWQIYK